MPPRFKDLLADDQLVRVFCVGRLCHPVVVDLFGLAGGYHGFWLDQEHGGLSYQEILLASTAARANDFDCFVRMAPTDYSQVTQNLEAGAGGVMAARIESADHAEQFVQWAKFAPRGSRGLNTSGRDADYTHKSQIEFSESANRDHLLAIQIETLGALNDADEIAANDAVDLLFIGPADLSQALGVLGQRENPKVWEAIDHVAAACRRHGKHWGIVPVDAEHAARCYDNGCRMLSIGSDVVAVRQGAEALLAAYSDLFGR